VLLKEHITSYFLDIHSMARLTKLHIISQPTEFMLAVLTTWDSYCAH